MIKTVKANPNKPPRIMIYGTEGVGKSTFGARADKPVFITPEGGADQLTDSSGELTDIMPNCSTWDQTRAAIHRLIQEEHDFRTLVIDSADWLEKICHKKIIGNSDRSITTCNGGYGAGYRESEALHRGLIEDLATLRDKRNMGIVITAHAHVKEVKDPSATENYDAYEIKCHEMVSSLWREWVDALLFVKHRAFIKTSEDKKNSRAIGDGSRAMYTSKTPAFQAKNRYNMPHEIEFDFGAWDVVKKHSTKSNPEEMMKDLIKLLAEVQDEATRAKVLDYIQDNEKNVSALAGAERRVQEIIKQQPKGDTDVTV